MKPLKFLGHRIRGWLPKEQALPIAQRINISDHLKRLQFLRVFYAAMLGALLVTPFGVYHSVSEPFVTGYLWGYNLPIGYVGLLSGIAVALYPKLSAFSRLRLSSLMPFIGLILLGSFLFAPNVYFINLLHGTNFSADQIDIDFQLGNTAAMSLALLSIFSGLLLIKRRN